MKRVKFLIFFLPAIISLAWPRTVLADAKTLDVLKDTYANQAYPDQNRGTLGSIIISNKHTTRLGYLQFEAVDLPSGAILDQAIMNFYVHEIHYSDRAKVNIGPITGGWEETAVTWNHKPLINQTQAIESEFSLTVTGGREIDVTPLVKYWYEEGQENHGIFIYPYGFLYGAAETEYAFTLKSKESGTQRANIVVRYHFEPTPTPTPTNTPTPTPTNTPTPTSTPTPKLSPNPTVAEETTPAPEGSPTPTPEAEEETGSISGLSSGQAITRGLVILFLIGSGIAALIYSRRKPAKKPKEKSAEGDSEEKKEEKSS